MLDFCYVERMETALVDFELFLIFMGIISEYLVCIPRNKTCSYYEKVRSSRDMIKEKCVSKNR